ncbi:MAG: DNA-formamidopyrimidine glycosylase [Solobacterium sp.]|nr:DNA-formamidopyrimidine glycosylase [Solobacterium sp.]
MPELPEVETVVRTLEHQIQNQKIKAIELFWPKVIEGDPKVFQRKLIGQRFQTFSRRGKYLLFGMDDCVLVVHLRMEGKFFLQMPTAPRNKHIHICFLLSNGLELRYQDTRKFGRMQVVPKDTDFAHFHDLGPEPFSDAFTAEYIHQYRKGKRLPVKSLLLDQSFVAGIGNIYADEILAACHIRPGRSCARLTRKNEEDIVEETRRILKAAIAAGGTTIRSYTSSLGVTGRFQLSCIVHGLKVCPQCGSEIKVKWIGGRSSYYCPQCQKV